MTDVRATPLDVAPDNAQQAAAWDGSEGDYWAAHADAFDALRDKANVALGYAWLQASHPVEAKPSLQRVRLDGPFSNKALLGVGWSDAETDDYRAALAPWLVLRDRSLLDSAVQESMLAVPYAFAQLGADKQAADHYVDAIEAFSGEIVRLTRSIEAIENAAYRRVAKGLRNPRWLRDAPLRTSFLTLSILLFGPVAFVSINLRIPLIILTYSLIILTTVVLYLLACDPLPPCVGKVTEWWRGLAASRSAASETNPQ